MPMSRRCRFCVQEELLVLLFPLLFAREAWLLCVVLGYLFYVSARIRRVSWILKLDPNSDKTIGKALNGISYD
jgi:hypothetical protein